MNDVICCHLSVICKPSHSAQQEKMNLLLGISQIPCSPLVRLELKSHLSLKL